MKKPAEVAGWMGSLVAHETGGRLHRRRRWGSVPSKMEGDMFFRKPKKKPKERDYLAPQQNWIEFAGFVGLLRDHNVRNYLEIGTRFGGTFNFVMRALPRGSRGTALDLPGGNWGTDSQAKMVSVVEGLRRDGVDAEVFFGNSQDPEMIAKALARGPYDAILIDGDHLYEGVAKDWANFGPHAPIIAFHDVAGEGVRQVDSGLPVEVPRLWQEIKASGAEVREFIGPNSGMGIGVVLRQAT